MKHSLLVTLPMIALLSACSNSIKYSVETPKTAKTSGQSSVSKNRTAIQNLGGKCFQKCILPDRYETAYVQFPIYNGTDPDAPVRIESLMTAPPQKVWVKNNTGQITLKQKPATFKEVRVLADTLFHKDFRMTQFEYKKLVEKAGAIRETEVVCSDARTPNLFLQVSTALKSYGYMNSTTTQWDSKFAQAVQQFQIDSSLPVGDLNLETLEMLGI
jgi:Putative peptidoglycan binding domain